LSIKNLLSFQRRFRKRVVENPEHNAERLIARAAMMVQGRIVDSIQRDPKTGAVYGNHQASAPGQPPATDTGQLVRSITMSVEGTEGEVVGVIRASAPYAAMLEYGTSNIAPRPYMQPGLESQRRKIEEMFRKGGLIK
jgi:HK97 gp10 family phage protein